MVADRATDPDVVLTAKTLRPPCLLKHVVRSDILKALNLHSSQRGDVMITDIDGVVKELVGYNCSLAPGASLGFPPDVVTALEQRLSICDHRLDFPISRAEVAMAVNGHSKFNADNNLIETNVTAVVDTLKSLNRPLSSSAFSPVGFQERLQAAILKEIRCLDDPVQFPIQPNPTFPDAPPTIHL